MSIQRLLGEQSGEFVSQYYQRLPYSRSGDGEFCHLGQWPSLNEILGHADADVMVVRRGEQRQGTSPRSAEEAQRLCDEGYTILVRHAERHDVRLAELAAGFQADLAGAVNIHIYVTPAEQFGFGWHYDAEEVFILQTAGKKEYSLRKNTVNPWPLEETLPSDMQYEREIMPLMKCLLSAGDWLYIPSGYWHMAQAQETAISLAVGIMPPTAIDLYDFLRRRLVSSLLWRQRLPPPGAASPLSGQQLRDAYRQLIRQLAADLQSTLADESLPEALLRHLRQGGGDC